MINRVLIRIKVVQLLYSYLLTKSDFKIEGAPEKQTRDYIYAYRTYVDILLLILKLSGQKLSPGDKALSLANEAGKNPFAKSVVAQSLAKLTDIKELGVKNAERMIRFNDTAEQIFSTLCNQSIVREFAKRRKPELSEDVKMWITLIDGILSVDETLLANMRSDEDFTIAGFQRGLTWAISTLNGYSDTQSSLIGAKRQLQISLQQAHLLYFALLQLPVEITKLQYEQLEAAKEKYLPTSADLNPNTRFVDNAYVATVRESEQMHEYFKENPFSWESDYFLLKNLLDKILESDIYKNYMAEPKTDYIKDAEFWRDIMRLIILPSDVLADALEAKSVFWNDDLYSIGTFVLKTIRRTETSESHQLEPLPEYKDEEDAAFGDQLFSDVVINFDTYSKMIESFVNESNWDPERLAFMDKVIICTALAEIMNFPKIPLVVSINEYIEIANFYSTPKSGQFVNGILYAICNHLQNEGKLHKKFENSHK